MNIIDTEGQELDVSLRCWRPHGNNTTYVITGLKDFYVSKNLQAGDTGDSSILYIIITDSVFQFVSLHLIFSSIK